MRDFLAATRDRVIVFDGSMGATLEQYDLSLEDDYKLPGRCHEALVLNRPDVIEQLHASMIEAGAEVVETDTFQGSRLKLEEWGLGEHTLEINRRAAEIARKAVGEEHFVAGSIGPTGFLPASDDPTLGSIRFRDLVEVFEEQARGLVEGGVDLIIIETAQDILEVKAAVFGAREAFKATGRAVPIQTSVSLLPNGGKMLLGTDISAALATLEALDVDVIGLNCSTGPEDMRDAVRFLGEHCLEADPLHPQRRHPAPGPQRRDDLPGRARAARRRARRLRRALRPRHRRRLLRHDDRAHRRHQGALHAEHAEAAPRPAAHPRQLDDDRDAARAGAGARRSSASASTRRARARRRRCSSPTTTTGSSPIAEDQVEGGAHVLDLCVALTERQDEDEQMRLVAKKVALTQPAPIQVDSTEPDVIETALEQIPGRAIVNSVNLEAGRDKLDRVVPIAKAHGAALIALTIDEVGMAKTRERKLEIATRIKELVCDEHGMDPEALIFDALTFTLTTGDDEWKPSAVETIEGIRLIKSELPGVKTSLGVSNVSFGIGVPARSVLNSVFLHHCVEAGLDLAMVNPNHITPYGEIPDEERKLADDLVFNRSDEALQHFIEHFESKSGEEEAEVADPTADMTPAGGAALAHPAPQAATAWRPRSTPRSRTSARCRRSTTCCCRP